MASILERRNYLLPFFVLGAVLINHALFRLGALSWVWTAVLAASVGGLALLAPQFDTPSSHRKPIEMTNAILGGVILAPLLLAFALSWDREFPFSGDAYFHAGQNSRMAFWWLSPVGAASVKLPSLDDVYALLRRPLGLIQSRIVVMVAILAIIAALFRWRLIALAFATLAFIAWGLAESSIFLRYPAGGYFFSLPFVPAAFVLNNPELAGRLSALLAAVMWLFVLRPWLIGRWPDWRILPVAALLLWHKDVIHYFNSVYLEPWGVIFALLAVELLVVRGKEGAPLGCLLIGAAACVKEPFILALPLVWLAGRPWTGPRDKRVCVTAAAFAAGIPFVLYYAARRSVSLDDIGADRSIRFGLPPDWPDYFSDYALQLKAAFPVPAMVLALCALAALIFVLWMQSDRRVEIALLAIAGIALAALFAIDLSSQRWAGYFRFLLYPLPFLLVGLLAFGDAMKARVAMIVGLLALALQIPSAWTAISRAAGPATDRNFVEHFDSPIVFPIKSLLQEARRSGALAASDPIRANLVDGTLRPLPGNNISYGHLGEMFCECGNAQPNIMGLFVRFTNLSKDLAHDPDAGSRIGVWQQTNEKRPACVARMKQTCARVFERVEGGETVAILGTSR